MNIDEIMRAAPVIPVLVLEGEADWAELARVFVGEGLPVLEVTLRTKAAVDAIRTMREVPGAIVGAGTVVEEWQLAEAKKAGSQFIVSPGLTDHLALAVAKARIPYLPGISTAGDVMRGLDLGLNRFKFFPAAASGGIPMLKALTGPFADVRFCPTGGIRPDNVQEWLALESVLCVGGTWLYAGPGDTTAEVAKRARALRDKLATN
ncbi:bifunctional 4-hydroxy-2-oxoglutarate aldolase/2-dehydro-3-deoxy-phosphogluconate aldolase [Sphingomonas limnosediminicola]|uniref:2-dehydro-3-deoxy-phosphogluconate aldolase n=1 Tax=Sphingomonas limnosediminicola TaxID=940133 RepID=A0ABP7KUL7_9SPHN